MSRRKDVFQGKVLQRLYQATKLEKAQESPSCAQSASKASVYCTASKVPGVSVKPVLPTRRLYTVLPPPEDFRTTSEEGCFTPAEPEPINDTGGSVEMDVCEVEEQKRRRRKRRKVSRGDNSVREQHEDRRTVSPPEGGTIQRESTAPTESNCQQLSNGHSQSPTDGHERLSRNRKRKLKKRRHKEKLRTLGLVPRATAVEFTYTQSSEEDEESWKERAAEVLDFLRTTQETYVSDRASAAHRLPLCPQAVSSLFNRLSDQTAPPADLTKLVGLQSLVQRQVTDHLAGAVEEFRQSATLSPEEASVVCTLFGYWMSDILPLHRDMPTEHEKT